MGDGWRRGGGDAALFAWRGVFCVLGIYPSVDYGGLCDSRVAGFRAGLPAGAGTFVSCGGRRRPGRVPGLLESGFAPERLSIGGDSAGGGLALATLLGAKAAGLPMPACALLFSPWTDLAGTGASLHTNRQRDAMLVSDKLHEGAGFYLNGADARNPLASPLYGDLAGLPPLLIQVGDTEILLDDSTRLADAARAAGVTVDLKIWENMPHVWQVSQFFLPEAREALDEAAAFAKTCLAHGVALAAAGG